MAHFLMQSVQSQKKKQKSKTNCVNLPKTAVTQSQYNGDVFSSNAPKLQP